jgi:hypothetical protein
MPGLGRERHNHGGRILLQIALQMQQTGKVAAQSTVVTRRAYKAGDGSDR